MISGTVKSVTYIEHIEDKLDFCKIVIDFDELYIYHDYNDLLTFIDKEVEYTTRSKLLEGYGIVSLVVDIANRYTVQTLDKREGIKLIPAESTGRAVCTFDVDTLKYGDIDYNMVALLISAEPGSSKKTKWIDCTMLDRHSKQFVLRVFTKFVEGGGNPMETIELMLGHYVKFDISYTRYGYQTEEIQIVNVPVVVAPEVEIAESVLVGVMNSDPLIKSYVESNDMLNVLRGKLSGDLGYELVYMAAELNMIAAVEDISDAYNFETLRRAVFATRGYLLPHNTDFSRPLLNFTKLSKSAMRVDHELLLIVDPMAEEKSSKTKKLYYSIREFTKVIINERRKTDEESVDITDVMQSCIRSGMF